MKPDQTNRRRAEIPPAVLCPLRMRAGHESGTIARLQTRTTQRVPRWRCDSCGLTFQLSGLAQLDRPTIRRVLGLPPVPAMENVTP